MSKASTLHRGALLRRGIGYALLAASAGCATHTPKTQFPLVSKSQQSKVYQSVCVQIGITPPGGKPNCNQLAQPNSKHHVEPLPLDEFGYLFPPLKPEPKSELTKASAKIKNMTPAKAAPRVAAVPTPSIAATTVPVIKAVPVVPVPSITTAAIPVTAASLQPVESVAAPVIAATQVSVTKAAPVVPVPSIVSAVAPITAAPLQPVANSAVLSIAVTRVPVAKTVQMPSAPAIRATVSPVTATVLPQARTPLEVIPLYITKTVHFSTRLPFKLNSAHLTRRNRKEILAFVNSLEKYRGVERIRITGHTDTSGPEHFNMWLSGMRAKSVQLWMLSFGVDPLTTYMRGVGSNEPRPHARSAADNRYVDITVLVRAPVR